MSPSVSVVIPVFNRPTEVKRSLVSVARQTYPVSEVIIVDDASHEPPDPDELNVIHARARLVRLPQNSGASAARQRGVDEASGDLVAFLDSDDVWFPGKLQAQVTLLDSMRGESRLTAVTCGWVVLDVAGRPRSVRIPRGTTTVADFASGCWFSPGSTALVPRHAFDVIGPSDPGLRRLEDLDWFLRFALQGGTLVAIPEIGAAIRTGRRGLSRYVVPAARRIEAQAGPALSPRASRRMRAWLAIETAAAARNDGAYTQMSRYLLRSFLLVPRARVQLEDWWARPAVGKRYLDRVEHFLASLDTPLGTEKEGTAEQLASGVG